MSRRTDVRSVAAILLATLVVSPDLGLAARKVPWQADVCVAGYVDKQKLAQFLLDGYGVTRAFEHGLPVRAELAAAPTWMRLFLLSNDVCELCTKEFKEAYKDDLKNVLVARQAFISMLRDHPNAYENVTGTHAPAVFLTDANARLKCRTQNGRPVEAAGSGPPPPPLSFPLRVRGTPDAMFIRPIDGRFKFVEPATISFVDNGVNHTRTDKLTAVIGYPIDLKTGADTQMQAQLIPYAGTNRNVSHTRRKPATFNVETVDAGLLQALYVPTAFVDERPLGHWFTGKIDHLWDLQHDSRLLSLNVVYTPTVNALVNDYIRVVPGRDDLLSFSPLINLRAGTGWYLDRGTTNRDQHEDYIRAGAQLGIALASDNAALPMDFVTTYTYLHGLDGHYDKVDYWKSSLSYAFDPKRLFSLGVSYSNGRREDTAQPEQLWSIGFNAKY